MADERKRDWGKRDRIDDLAAQIYARFICDGKNTGKTPDGVAEQAINLAAAFFNVVDRMKEKS